MQARRNRRRRLAALLAPLVLVGGLAGRLVFCVGDNGHQGIETAHAPGSCHRAVTEQGVADESDVGGTAGGCEDIAFGVVIERASAGTVFVACAAAERSVVSQSPPLQHGVALAKLRRSRPPDDSLLASTVLRL